MKEYGKVTTTNVIILATVTIVFIGAFISVIPILQQKTNAQYDPGHTYDPSSGYTKNDFPSLSDEAHSKQQGGFNTSGPHENSTRLK